MKETHVISALVDKRARIDGEIQMRRYQIARLKKGMLKAELKRRDITYADLVGKLADIGVMDSEPNIRNKISRGKFTAVFLIQCLRAIGADTLRLD